MSAISRKKLIAKIEALLLAVCISIVPLKYIFGIYNNNTILYGILIIFCGIAIIEYMGVFGKFHRRYAFIIAMSVIISLLALITLPFSSTASGMDAIKPTILLFLAICVYSLPVELINNTIQYTIFINLAYAVLVVIGFRSVNSFLLNGENYLTMNLSISLCLAIVLCKLVCEICFNNAHLKSIIFDLICGGLLFLGIMKFSGRTAFIYPFVTAMIIPIFASTKHRSRLIKVYLIIGILSYIAYWFFMKYIDAYTLSRMMRLMENTSEEKRFEIWRDCIRMIFERKWFLLGGGINAFQDATGYYPHNLFLQLWSEYGVFGLALSIGTFTSCFHWIKQRNREFVKASTDVKSVVFFWEAVGGCLYLFLTFLKSFTIYDAVSLYIFVAFVFKVSNCDINAYSISKINDYAIGDGQKCDRY